jgi:hypothetical protein
MKPEKVLQIAEQEAFFAEAQRDIEKLRQEDPGLPQEFDGLDERQLYSAIRNQIVEMLRPDTVHQDDSRLAGFTPRVDIQFQYQKKPKSLTLFFEVDESMYKDSLTAYWYDGDKEIVRELIGTYEIDQSLSIDLNNFAWAFVQYRDAILNLPLETAVEVGFKVETMNRLTQEAGRLYLAP